MSDEWKQVKLKSGPGVANGGGKALDLENYDIAEWLENAINRRLFDIQMHPYVAFIFKGKHRIYKVTSGNRSHSIMIQYKEK
ncbi:MAG: hypothetical protein WBL37_00425 [Dehalococcoidales bacterium]